MKKNTSFKKAKLLVPFLFLLFSSIIVQAQNSKLNGKVVDENQTPLSGATVLIKSLNKGTTTNTNGNFRISVPKGSYNLEISYLGYATITQEIQISETTTSTFVLTASAAVLDEVLVSAVRVGANAPVTHSNISKKELAKRNLGQDIPSLLNYLPSVVTTSDAGAGIGYSSLRVRGSDASRINVTINGIPYNDAESQGTFWVNLGDFTSSVENIQLQRGVGTSTNGAGAFGASLNLLTDGISQKQGGQISSSIGSFNTLKNTVKFNTGLLNNHLELSGRFSKIRSDGYLDRASSDLESYFLQANYIDDNTLIKALLFGGEEITYQAWYGVDAATAASDRTFNAAGAIYDNSWNIRAFYDNQVDNYKQDHAQLHWNQKYNNTISSNVALHYTRGRGFYEEYNQAWGDDGNPINVADQVAENADNIVRRYANSHFYGITYSLNYKNEVVDFILGGAANKHEGRHFGETIWNRFAGTTEIRDIYYDRPGNKTDVNIFAKVSYKITDKLDGFVDLQQRRVSYKAEVKNAPLVDEIYNFFNPKVGLSYTANEANNFYISYAKAHKEAGRGDFKEIANTADFPRPEELNDFELGWRYKSENMKLNSNIYYMKYVDQLVLTGQVDNNGAFSKTNSGKSYRLGIEIDADIKFNEYISIRPNATFSNNKNLDFNRDINNVPTNFGNTDISFSPEIVAANTISVKPVANLELALLSKYVSEQFLTNLEESDKKLADYFTNDLNVNYVFIPKSVFTSITFNALVNNIFSEKYISNGYYDPDWGTYFYPQATRNFLVGVTFNF
ncbi:TonB-dependent receptor [Flavicella sediminum]|uniref:TonB-dependent receptor n=1 Tax=Flavicella sediminum TaxID=2585141 RepID=UPI001123BE38|nr:TonB-dependent receptor [Flavicella sediminum]